MKIKILLLFFLLLEGGFAFTQKINSAILEFQNLESLTSASWSIKAQNLTKNSEIISVNSKMSLIPASTMKVLTTGIALLELGPDYKFKTVFAYRGEIQDSLLNGDLLIFSGGDPSLGNTDFYDFDLIHRWMDKLKHYGVSRINGNLILSESHYKGQLTPSTWVYQDLGNYYGASPSSLSYLNNTFQITFAQNPVVGGETIILSPDPEELGIILLNEVRSGPNNSGDRAYVYGCPKCNEYVVRGTIPAGVGTFTIKASNPNPGMFFLKQMENQLEKNKIKFKGELSVLKSYNDSFIRLDSQISVPLFEILRETNVNSNNLYAEHILLEMARNESFINSEKAIENFFNENLNPEGLFAADGSGLSRYNAISTSNHLDLFEYIYNSSQFDTYLKTFPLGGKEGTVKNMFNSGKAQYYVKSGTLSRVKAFAGFIKNSSEEIIAFSFIVNNFKGNSSDISSQMEKVIMSLTD